MKLAVALLLLAGVAHADLKAPDSSRLPPEVMARLLAELARLDAMAAAEEVKSPRRPAVAREIAFYLLAGLDGEGTANPTLTADEKAALRMRCSSSGVTHIGRDAWLHHCLERIQDKSGSYSMETLELYVRSERKGWGQIARSAP
jgi:hypothetical protein